MDKLTPDHFSFKCPMRWEEMAPSENGKFCGRCRKEVFDLTDCSVDEVIALQRKHGSICGSIHVVQAAAAVAVSLSAAACQNGGVSPDKGASKPGDPPVVTQRMAGTPLAPNRLKDDPSAVMGKVKAPDCER